MPNRETLCCTDIVKGSVIVGMIRSDVSLEVVGRTGGVRVDGDVVLDDVRRLLVREDEEDFEGLGDGVGGGDGDDGGEGEWEGDGDGVVPSLDGSSEGDGSCRFLRRCVGVWAGGVVCNASS